MTRAEGHGLRVLQSTPVPGPRTNPYVSQLHQALREEGVDVVPFTWRVALLGRYDLLHTHWPETLLHGRGRGRTLGRQLLSAALVARLTLTRAPVVRTLHNVAPHEPVPGAGGTLLRALERRESWWVRLNATTPVPHPDRCTTILHGHYRDRFVHRDPPAPVPGRLVVPGVVRTYKGIDVMVAALQRLDVPDVALHVVGRVEDQDLAARLRAAAAQDPRLHLTLRHVSEAELADAVGRAQLVVLPYRAHENSGTALLALSLARPVLLPRTAAGEQLAHEVGRDWVHLADVGHPEALAAAVVATLDALRRHPPEQGPDLSARGWAEGARLHVQAYRAALGARAGTLGAVPR